MPEFRQGHAECIQPSFFEKLPLKIKVPDHRKLNRVHIKPVLKILSVFCPPSFFPLEFDKPPFFKILDLIGPCIGNYGPVVPGGKFIVQFPKIMFWNGADAKFQI